MGNQRKHTDPLRAREIKQTERHCQQKIARDRKRKRIRAETERKRKKKGKKVKRKQIKPEKKGRKGGNDVKNID